MTDPKANAVLKGGVLQGHHLRLSTRCARVEIPLDLVDGVLTTLTYRDTGRTVDGLRIFELDGDEWEADR